MNEYEFRDLLASVADEFGHTDRYLLADLRHTVIEDLVVNFIHDPNDPKRLVLHFELGELPAGDEPAAMERLLRLNLLSGTKTTGVFALAPTTADAMYAVHFFEPERASPQQLAEAVREHARKAKLAAELIRAPVGAA